MDLLLLLVAISIRMNFFLYNYIYKIAYNLVFVETRENIFEDKIGRMNGNDDKTAKCV